MGCHTWFYKKIEGPSLEEIKCFVIDKSNKEIEFLNRMIHDRDSIDADLLASYPEWTPEYAKNNIPIWKEKIKLIEVGGIDVDELLDIYFDFNWSEVKDFVEGKGWFISSDDLPHDLFRQYGYPDDRLFSLEETLQYIKDNGCTTYEWTEEKLKEFWNKHPDGMINFG